MFGTRQRENGIIMLTEYNKVLEATEIAESSAGNAAERMNAYNQGLEASINRVKVEWEKLILSLKEGEGLKLVFGSLEGLLTLINTSFVQSFIKAGAVVGALVLAFKGFGILKTLGVNLYAFILGLKTMKVTASGVDITIKGVTTSLTTMNIALGVMVAVLGTATFAISMYNQHQDELRQNALDVIDTAKEEASEIENLKTKIEELRKALDKSNLSMEDTYSKRAELIEIQKTLVGKYGLEKDAIDLVNGGLKEQIELLDEAAKKRASENWAEISPEYTKAQDWMKGIVSGSIIDPFDTYPAQFLMDEFTSDKSIQMDLENLAKKSGLTTSATGKYTPAGLSREDAIKALDDFSDALSEYMQANIGLVSDKNFNKIFEEIQYFSKNIKGDTAKWDERKKILQEGIESQVKGYYTNELDYVTKAEEKYNKAKIEGNKDTTDEAYNYLMEKIKEAADKAQKDGNDAVSNYFKDIGKDYEKSPIQKFTEEITTGNQKWISEAIKGGIDVSEALEKVAGWYGVESEEVKKVIKDIENLDVAQQKTYDPNLSNESSKALENLSGTYNLLSNAIDEYSKSGNISISTLVKMSDSGSDVLKYLDIQDGELVINKNAMLDYAKATIEAAKANEILRQQELKSKKEDLKTTFMNVDASDTTAYNSAVRTLRDGISEANKGLAESENNLKLWENIGKGLDQKGIGFLKGDSKDSSKDSWKDAFESKYNALKHQLEMEEITEKEYYDTLEGLYKDYFAGRKKYIEEENKYEEEVYKGRKKLAQEEYDDKVSNLKRLISLSENEEQTEESRNKQIEIYKNLQEEAHLEAERLREQNIIANKDEIAELGEAWWEYYYKIRDLRKENFDEEIERYKKVADNNDYYNNWTLSQKLIYLQNEKEAISETYKDEIASKKEYAEAVEEIDKQIYDTSKEIAEQKVDQIDAYLSYVNDVIDGEIEKLNKEKEALEENNDERERAIRLAELEEKLARAKRNKVLVYKKGEGFVYQQDETAVRAAQRDIDKFNAEEQLKAQEKSIDDAIDKWEEYRKEWNDVVDNYKKEQNRLIGLQYTGRDTEKDILNKRIENVRKFAEDYVKAMDKVKEYKEKKISSEEKKSDSGGSTRSWSDLVSGEVTERSETSNQKKYLDNLISAGSNPNASAFDKGNAIWAKDQIAQGAYADGTVGTSSNELSLVGENGRELKLLPKGTGIVPNPQTETLMSFANNPAGFINKVLNNPYSSSQSNTIVESYEISGNIYVEAEDVDGLISSFKRLKNKAIQKSSVRK